MSEDEQFLFSDGIQGCVCAGRLDFVERWLQQGANVNQTDGDGYTLLMEAAYTGEADMIRLLLKAGADAAAQNRFGRTALVLAEEIGHEEAVAAFLEMGVTE